MEFLSKDPLTGITRWMQYDPMTDTLTEKAEADTTQNLEHSNSLRNDEDYWKKGVKNEMAHYAHIPNILLEKWANEGVDINDNQALFDMVNKPEYAYLKTTTKHVGG
jgi:hypothetical protein